MSNWARRLSVLFEPAPADWWMFWRTFRCHARPEKRVGATLAQHRDGLAGNIPMWTYGGIHYWWVKERLWSCRDRTDEERGISKPLTPEEKRAIGLVFWIMRLLIFMILLFDVIVIWKGG